MIRSRRNDVQNTKNASYVAERNQEDAEITESRIGSNAKETVITSTMDKLDKTDSQEDVVT